MAIVRHLGDFDLAKVAAIHSEAFPRQGWSEEWVACNVRAFPRMRYYVAENGGNVCGYILWTEKSGFRQRVVLELEQMAVAAEWRGKGIGAALIAKSLPDVASKLSERGATLAYVMVTTRSDNSAQTLYRRALGAEVVAVVPSLFSGDEVLMLSRDPLRSNSTLERT